MSSCSTTAASAMLGTEFQEMLRCIRCGACMNHCPVYHAVGGHAYGWVYPGPMGAVLTPSLIGVDKAGHLPNASTFCGRCESVCPMKIPLPKMMRHWREREFERGLNPAAARSGLKFWAFFAQRPALYRLTTAIGMPLLSLLWRQEPALRLAAAGRRLDAGTATCRRRRARPSCSRCAARRPAGGAMSGREAILGKVRTALKAKAGDTARLAAVERTHGQVGAGHHPGARATAGEGADRPVLRQAVKLFASVERLASADAVPAAVAGYLSAEEPAAIGAHGRRPTAVRPALVAGRARSRSGTVRRTATTRLASATPSAASQRPEPW